MSNRMKSFVLTLGTIITIAILVVGLLLLSFTYGHTIAFLIIAVLSALFVLIISEKCRETIWFDNPHWNPYLNDDEEGMTTPTI